LPPAPVPLQENVPDLVNVAQARPFQGPDNLPQAPLAPVAVNNGEINNDPFLIPSQSECDVYVSQNIKEKIWNREYVDLALLLYQIFVSQIYKPQSVISYDNQLGVLVVQSNKNSKAKGIQNISTWTDAFVNYMKIFLQRFPNLVIELLTYMSIIRGTSVPFENIYRYDQQFRLRMQTTQIDLGHVSMEFCGIQSLPMELLTPILVQIHPQLIVHVGIIVIKLFVRDKFAFTDMLV
jgi:hypothetical protein